MTKNLSLLLMSIVLGIAVVNAQTAVPPSPVRGFAGYEFGSGIDAIAADMKTEGYELIDSNENALWYSSTLLGIDCELGYVFTDYRLIGGSMVLKSDSREDFARVAEHMRQAYNATLEVQVTQDKAVARIAGPDAWIVHTLNFVTGNHEITYHRTLPI